MQQNLTNILENLISINSQSSDKEKDDLTNENVIDYLMSELRPLGFTCHKIKVKDARNKFNLIAKYGLGDGGICFSGHTDTVPANAALWHSNPWQLKEEDDKWIGLGVIDMKGFFAHVINVLKKTNLTALKHPIYILATADEETTMSGAIEICKKLKNASSEVILKNFKPSLICIGEPTSLVPIIMHKGQIVIKVEVYGQSGHSSNPYAGINAIKIMNRVITSLNEFEEELQKQKNHLFPVDHQTLNIGQINGGDAPNRICDYCSIVFDIRLMPGFNAQQMYEKVKNKLQALSAQYPNRINITIPYAPVEAFDGKLTNSNKLFLEELTNKKCEAVNYATEATYLQELAPTVILGAGDIANAHQPDEYLLKSEADKVFSIYQQLIAKFCN